MNVRIYLISVAVFCQVGCSRVPTAGPTASQVIDQAAPKNNPNFTLVEVDPHVIAALAAEPSQDVQSLVPNSGPPPNPTIGVGDTISVEIWDSASGSIFGPPTADTAPGALPTVIGSGNRSVIIREQPVAPDGGITIPYAGRIQAVGRTPLQLQQTIEQRLATSSFEPKALVTVSTRISQNVTVSGETVSGMRIPLSLRGDRLLEVIAAAGGSKSAPYETAVRLSRQGVTVTIPMEKLLSDPDANIYALPGDIITVLKIPQTFSVFGATLNNIDIPFGANRVNLAQAIAKAGGLLDTRADPEGVFLFRFEPPPVMQALGGPLTPATPAGQVPVVYHLNLRNVGNYFLAKNFPLRDDDMIYVANAPFNDLQKFFTLVSSISSPVLSGLVLRTELK